MVRKLPRPVPRIPREAGFRKAPPPESFHARQRRKIVILSADAQFCDAEETQILILPHKLLPLRRLPRRKARQNVALQSRLGAGFQFVDKTGKPVKTYEAINNAAGFKGNEAVTDSQTSAYFGPFGSAGKLICALGKDRALRQDSDY
jgi:hypothetical protein